MADPTPAECEQIAAARSELVRGAAAAFLAELREAAGWAYQIRRGSLVDVVSGRACPWGRYAVVRHYRHPVEGVPVVDLRATRGLPGKPPPPQVRPAVLVNNVNPVPDWARAVREWSGTAKAAAGDADRMFWAGADLLAAWVGDGCDRHRLAEVADWFEEHDVVGYRRAESVGIAPGEWAAALRSVATGPAVAGAVFGKLGVPFHVNTSNHNPL